MPKASIESFAIELESLTGKYRRGTGDVVLQQGRGHKIRLKLADLEPLPNETLAPATRTAELFFFFSEEEFGVPRTGHDLGVSRQGNLLWIFCLREDFDRTWQLLRLEETVYLSWAERSDGLRSESWALSTDGESRVRVWPQRPEERPVRESLEPARVLADVIAGSILRGALPGSSDRTTGENILGSALIDTLRGRDSP